MTPQGTAASNSQCGCSSRMLPSTSKSFARLTGIGTSAAILDLISTRNSSSEKFSKYISLPRFIEFNS